MVANFLSMFATVLPSVVLWSMLAIFIAANLFWLYEIAWIWRYYEPPTMEYGPDDVQVRILTVDAAAVVQQTVDALPEEFTDRHVIAETPMDIKGATVHIVPESFDCKATRKGRALEWARRNLPCEKEFLLFLDEDTTVTSFPGLPEADIVQFREEPQPTGSLVSYLSEMYRMGFQLEQFAFQGLDYPLYTWGGGLAIRKAVEDQVTWNTDTVIEDTKFVWRAMGSDAFDFTVVRTRFQNQSPYSLRAMIDQRRRWIAGSREEHRLLPGDYALLYGIRDLSWALSPLAPFLFSLPFAIKGLVVFQPAFQTIAIVLFGLVFVWCLLGIGYFRVPMPESLLLLLVSPVIVVPHAIGALYGMLVPPSTFEVTPKAKPPTTPGERTPSSSADVIPPFDGPGSALVLGASIDTATVLDRLAGETPDETDALLFTWTRSAVEWVESQLVTGRDRPAQLDFVPIGEAIESGEPSPLPEWFSVIDEIQDPSDPVYLMILLDRYLSSWSSSPRAVIWFDSLTALLESVDLYTALGFVNVVSDVAKRSGATVYFHLDPSAHDERTVRLFQRECDVAVPIDTDQTAQQSTPAGTRRSPTADKPANFPPF